MKFLNTQNTMNIEEHEKWGNCVFELKDEMLDLIVPEFIKLLEEDLENQLFDDKPYLFTYNCDDLTDEDILYTKNMVYEIVADTLRGPQSNKDWQPRPTLLEHLDANLRALTMLLNYEIKPQILNVVFVKNGKILYSLVKEKN